MAKRATSKPAGPPDHEEELAELQRRFNALSDQRKSADLNSTLLTKELARPPVQPKEKPKPPPHSDYSAQEEIRRLDEQIIDLRKKHDRLHDSNQIKRRDIAQLTDKLADLHNNKYKSEESPEASLRAMEEKLFATAERYDGEHATKMTYEQIIKRLKQERLTFPAELKALEATLAQKEADYEQLLIMSHDANQSKEIAKSELSKFEVLVSEERKLREKELQERRSVLQKKQMLAVELDQSERERRALLAEQASRGEGADTAKAQAAQTEKLIQEEMSKIAAYEAAFEQIKQATGVADVNEVIQRFLSQEETHQKLLRMTRDSQHGIQEVRAQLAQEKMEVEQLQYSLGDADAAAPAAAAATAEIAEIAAPGSPTPKSHSEARLQLERARARWKKTWHTLVNCKAAVQHVVELLDPLRGEDELLPQLSDETLLQHLQWSESKLQRVAAAFFQEEERHAELLASSARSIPKQALLRQQTMASDSGRWPGKPGESESDEDFEEELEDEVVDRETLKKASGLIVDKVAKKKKPKRKKMGMAEEPSSPAKTGTTSTARLGAVA